MASSPSSWCQRDQSSFSSDGPVPPAPADSVRSACARIASRPIHARASLSRITGSPLAPVCLASSTSRFSSRSKPTCWPRVATPRSMASVALATRQPSPGSPTTRLAWVRASSKKTSLNSEVPVRPDRDPLLPHRDQQVGQARAALGPRLGAGQHETPVGLDRQRRPHLLPGDHPLLPARLPFPLLQASRGGHRGQVGAGARLGVALAPEFLDRPDRLEEPLLLLRRAERDQRWPEQFLT